MEVELFSSQFFVALFSIIVLDLVLAGDNAVVIAMASNRLPAQLRTRAIYVGTAGAVKTIIIADAAMGIDNVIAIAGASHGDFLLVVLGLLISVPIVVGGSQLIGKLMEKYPVLVVLGAAILGWTGGTMIVHDRTVGVMILEALPQAAYILPAVLAAAVCGVGVRMRRRG